jgi:hypothetical protein
VSRLDKNYPTGKNRYFNALKSYSFGKLEYSLGLKEPEQIGIKYFARKEPYLAHPAYQHLFNAIYSNYLTQKSQVIGKMEAISPALKGNFREFADQLIRSGYSTEITELLAVKCFYDGYFSNKLDKKMMLKGLKEATAQCSYEPLKNALPGMLFKITSLQAGTTAPALLLKNIKAETSSLKPGNKFIYLAFFNRNSKESREELDSLVSLDKKLNTILTVVPVSLDVDFQEAAQWWKLKKYPWELKGAIHPDKASADYQIKTTPVFYLLSPDLKLVLSPALSPTHNFESLFLKIYRETRFKQQKR